MATLLLLVIVTAITLVQGIGNPEQVHISATGTDRCKVRVIIKEARRCTHTNHDSIQDFRWNFLNNYVRVWKPETEKSISSTPKLLYCHV